MTYIAITGANGFVGGHLCARLSAEGFFIKALVRSAPGDLEKLSNASIIKSDMEHILDTKGFFKGCSMVIHCAAKVHEMGKTGAPQLEEYRKENTTNTVALARKCLKEGVRTFIFFSTVKVFGDAPGIAKVLTEDDEPRPSDPYGISKYEAEQGLRDLFKSQHNARCVIVRLPMVYGPGNKGNMRTLLKAASRRVPLPLKGATGKRSMIYVKNIGDAVCKILESGSPADGFELYTLTDSVDYTTRDLYSILYSEINKKSGVFFIPPILLKTIAHLFPGGKSVIARLFDEYRFSCDKFMQTYSWKPLFTFKEGLRDTAQWYKAECIS
jgi:nucleoside-diphosphate-sugar epimerase